jgi:prophage regulatory protein
MMRTETTFTQRTLRIRHVAEKTSLAISSIWRLAQQGHFPLPVKLSPGCTAWYEHEIDEWLDAKAKERGVLVPLTDSGEQEGIRGGLHKKNAGRVS